MIASRQIAFGRGGKRKPYDAEIEYLESTGTQYIVTDYVPNDNSVAELDFQSVGDSPSLMGVYSASSRFNLGISMSNKNWFGGIGSGNTATTTALADSARRKLILDAPQKTLTASDVGSYPCGSGSVGGNTVRFNLFARNYLNADGRNLFPARLYGVKFSEGGVVVHDLIPVRKGNIGYLYDRVSGQLFGNQGTGEFVLGPDIIDYTAKDYVQDGLIRMLDSIETTGFGQKNYDDGTVLKNLATGVDSYVTIGKQVTKGQPLLNVVKGIDNGVFLDSVSDIEAAFGGDTFTLEVHAVIPSNFIGVFDSSGYGDKICTIYGWGTSVGFYMGGKKHSVKCDTTTVHSFSMTRNGDVCKGYIDGVLCLTFDATVSDVPDLNRFYVRVNQQIGSLRFYSRALDDSEIAHNYSIDKARFGL